MSSLVFSHTEITRLLSDKRRSQTTSAQSVFANAANAAGQSSAQDVTASSDPLQEANVLKAKADALACFDGLALRRRMLRAWLA